MTADERRFSSGVTVVPMKNLFQMAFVGSKKSSYFYVVKEGKYPGPWLETYIQGSYWEVNEIFPGLKRKGRKGTFSTFLNK